MTNVRLPEPRSLPERIRSRTAAMLGLGESGHVDGTIAQDLVDGLLPGRQAARVRRHIERCGRCAEEVEGFARIISGLEALPRFTPSMAFADQVMAMVDVAPQVAPQRSTETRGWLAAARRLVPRTRRAWAALSGAAVTPVATVGLVLYAVFSHPTLTVDTLLSYLSWQIADLAAMGWGAMVGLLAQGIAALGLRDLLGAAASAPMAIAAVSTLYSVLVVMALRVLYKNLVTARSVDTRNA
jgi:anti-sigma factor RsiW